MTAPFWMAIRLPYFIRAGNERGHFRMFGGRDKRPRPPSGRDERPQSPWAVYWVAAQVGIPKLSPGFRLVASPLT